MAKIMNRIPDLLVIDVQHGFLPHDGEPLSIPGTSEVISSGALAGMISLRPEDDILTRLLWAERDIEPPMPPLKSLMMKESDCAAWPPHCIKGGSGK